MAKVALGDSSESVSLEISPDIVDETSLFGEVGVDKLLCLDVTMSSDEKKTLQNSIHT